METEVAQSQCFQTMSITYILKPSPLFPNQSLLTRCSICFCPQGNMQRCKLVMDQVTEARDTMMKVLDHKEKVLKLLNKNGAVKKSSKLKRKERA